MTDLLTSTAVLLPLVAAGLAALLLLTVVPYVLTLILAERQRVSASRWGAVALAGILAALAVTGHLLFRTDLSLPAALPPLIFTWLAPGALLLMGDEAGGLGGRVGTHEHPPRQDAGTGAVEGG